MADGLAYIEPLEGWQLSALQELVRYPRQYAQRLHDCLQFPDPGGQHWTRELQIVLPSWETHAVGVDLPSNEKLKFIVPLGLFLRKRHPDFKVTDADGRLCPLVSRYQHGHAFLSIVFKQFLTPAHQAILNTNREQDDELLRLIRDADDSLAAMFTTVRGEPGYVSATEASNCLDDLIKGLEERHRKSLEGAIFELPAEPDLDDEQQPKDLFSRDFKELEHLTHYLCWVEARPGDIVNLRVTYTVDDAPRLSAPKLESEDPARGAPGNRRFPRLDLTKWYSQTGIGPANYETIMPATDHVASYYFTIEPPPATELSFLDWENGQFIEGIEDDRSWACAKNGFNLHVGPKLAAMDPSGNEPTGQADEEKASSVKHVFMRPLPTNQVQIVLGAALNLYLAFVFALSPHGFELESPSTALFFLTPVFLIGYIAHQRRHHYASTTHWLRGALWLYVAVNTLFLLTVASRSEASLSQYLVPPARPVTVLFAAASASMIVAFVAMGSTYRASVASSYASQRKKSGAKEPIDMFVSATENAGHLVVANVAVAAALAGGVISLLMAA